MFGQPSHRVKMRRRNLVLIVAAAAAAGIIALLFFTGRIPAFSLVGTGTHTVNKVLPETVTASSEGFLYSEGSRVYLLNTSGQETWSIDVGFSDVSTAASDDLILNWSGPNLQAMLYTKEQLFATSVDSPILGGAAGREYVAVLLDAPTDDSGTQQMIYLFDKSGQKTGQLSFGRQVIDFGFFSDSTLTDLFWTLSLDTSGAAPMSYITMYNKASGEMTYSITVSSRVIDKVIVTSNLIFANGSGSLTAYTYFGEPQANQQVQGWRIGALASDTSSLYIAYTPRASAAYIEAVQTFRADGAAGSASFTDERFGLPVNVIGVAISPAKLFAFTSDTVYRYSLDGRLERTQRLGVKVSRIKQVSDSYAVLWGEHDTYIMRLQ